MKGLAGDLREKLLAAGAAVSLLAIAGAGCAGVAFMARAAPADELAPEIATASPGPEAGAQARGQDRGEGALLAVLAPGPAAFALQGRLDGPTRAGPPGPQLQPGPDGSRLTEGDGAFKAGPDARDPFGPFSAIRTSLSVATGVLALLAAIQLGLLAVARWRGRLFVGKHEWSLRGLAWLALLIGLAEFSATAVRTGSGPWTARIPVADVGVASAIVLASLFLFAFAHAVGEAAKIADDHMHTV